MPDPIAAIVDRVAAELEGVEVTGPVGARAWSIGGTPFAREVAGGLEVTLDPAVAAAALRTSDTHRSDEGADRIVFRPTVIDRFAQDRIAAWFGHACRVARERRAPD